MPLAGGMGVLLGTQRLFSDNILYFCSMAVVSVSQFSGERSDEEPFLSLFHFQDQVAPSSSRLESELLLMDH